MQVDHNADENLYKIQHYNAGIVKINGQEYSHSLIITPTILIDNWPVTHYDDLTEATLQPIINLKPELVLLGTGEQGKILPHKQLIGLHNQRIGVECMSNAAACRTFIALSSEGRQVAAALIIGC